MLESSLILTGGGGGEGGGGALEGNFLEKTASCFDCIAENISVIAPLLSNLLYPRILRECWSAVAPAATSGK